MKSEVTASRAEVRCRHCRFWQPYGGGRERAVTGVCMMLRYTEFLGTGKVKSRPHHMVTNADSCGNYEQGPVSVKSLQT